MANLAVHNQSKTENVGMVQKTVHPSPSNSFEANHLSTLSSQESIQLWIDSLSHCCVPDGSDEEIEAMTSKLCSSDEKKSFLTVSETDDELFLGAEAKTLRSSPNAPSLSPRISPLPSMDSSYELWRDKPANEIQNGKETDIESDEQKNSLSISQPQSLPESLALLRKPSDISNSVDSVFSQDSFIDSVYSLRCILNQSIISPEEMLISLGFSGKVEPLLSRIPSRFLKSDSSAAGIDVDKFVDENVDLISEESAFGDLEFKRNRLLTRFSQSSIDLSSVDSDILASRRKRRTVSVPTILVDSADDTDSSHKTNASKASNIQWSKLSTLEEECEPPYTPRKPWRSPIPSPSCDRRPSLQRQSNVDLATINKSFSPTFFPGSSSQEGGNFADHNSMLGSPRSSLEKEEREFRVDSARRSLSTDPEEQDSNSNARSRLVNISSFDIPCDRNNNKSTMADRNSEVAGLSSGADDMKEVTLQNLVLLKDDSSPSSPCSKEMRLSNICHSPRTREARQAGKIEEKITHLRSLLKLDEPPTLMIPRPPDIKGFGVLTSETSGSITAFHLRNGLLKCYGGSNILESSKNHGCSDTTIQNSINKDNLESVNTAADKDVGEKGMLFVDQLSNKLDNVDGDNTSVPAYCFENGVTVTSNIKHERLSPSSSLPTSFSENNDVSMQNFTECLPRLENKESPNELLEKLSNSRLKLKKAKTNHRYNSLDYRLPITAGSSLPNILDNSSALNAVNENQNTCNTYYKISEDVENFKVNSAMVDKHSDVDFRHKPAKTLLHSMQTGSHVASPDLLSGTGKMDSGDSSHTFTYESVHDKSVLETDSPNHLEEDQGLQNTFLTPTIVVSSGKGNNDESVEILTEANTNMSHKNGKDVSAVDKEFHFEVYGSEKASRNFNNSELEAAYLDSVSNEESKLASRTETPVSIIERTKARMMAKGYSVDSSGFEDESEMGRTSPIKFDKRPNPSMTGDLTKLPCHLCQDSKSGISSPYLTPCRAGKSDHSSKNGRHRDKVCCVEDPGNQCVYCFQDGLDDLSDLNVLCLDHDHFDYLVQHLMLLKDTVENQEKRLKEHFSDKIKWKDEAFALQEEVKRLKRKLEEKEEENDILKGRLQNCKR